MLNPSSPLPLYHQLSEIILSRIRSGEYPPGGRIPSEHQLAATYRIGRPTARQAVELLVRRRWLERRRGSGTYVREKRREIGLFSLDGTHASFQREGLSVSTHVLSPMQSKPVDPSEGNPFSGKKAYCFSRLIRVETAPVLVEDMFFDPVIFSGIDAIDLQDRSLSEIVEEHYYRRPVQGKQNFRIGYPDIRIAAALEVEPSATVLMVERYLDFPKAARAFYAELFCRTDRYVFSQTIGGTVDG
ncbi:MAG: GntR family transcriptional regulator [Deltaproteobacteria bacterium SG8_13]|nr:MAG: GntR family transcriptional regulator [Deltaproteobacteria bacterium SG8_13]